MHGNTWLFWTCLALTLALSVGLSCFNKIARNFPINYISLLFLTFFSTYVLGSICIYYSAERVMIAMAMTFTVFFSLTLLTFFVSQFWP
jgi:FtsH-binding integral membrane protein